MRLGLIGLLCAAALPSFASDAAQAIQAERELFAARFDKAADLYAVLVKSDPAWAPGYYGQVRALLGAYRAKEAYAAAEAAQKAVPGTAPAETALGMAAYRRGEIAEAERHFRLALRLDQGYAGALTGLARVLETISKFKTARDLYQAAYRSAPNDPECILLGLASQQEGAEHIATLQRVLAIYDPETPQERSLRAHIGLDKAIEERKLSQLTSPYQHYDIKLIEFFNRSSSKVGVGLDVEINNKKFRFLLSTAASGILMSPNAVKRAGLAGLSSEMAKARIYSLLAPVVKIGELTLADVPVTAFSGASPAGDDGIIGADVFREFLVGIDFVHGRMSLDPFAERPPERLDDAPDVPTPGFTQAVRVRNYLSLPTSVNGGNGRLFLIDSSSSLSLINNSNENHVENAALVFAGFSVENSPLWGSDMGEVSDPMGVGIAGTLGMSILQQMKLTIDYREGSVRLEQVKR